jgi:hypothetical protein
MYYKAKRSNLRIDDRGDILILYEQHNPEQNIKIDVQTSKPEAATKMENFLGA